MRARAYAGKKVSGLSAGLAIRLVMTESYTTTGLMLTSVRELVTVGPMKTEAAAADYIRDASGRIICIYPHQQAPQERPAGPWSQNRWQSANRPEGQEN